MRVKDLKIGDVVTVQTFSESFDVRVLSTLDRSGYENGKWIECGLVEYVRLKDGKKRSCDIQYVTGFAKSE